MSVDYQNICATLYRETRLLDDRQWGTQLECYTEDVVYWMLAWDDDDQLTDDPHSQVSLMHYTNRCGLEDRASHVKTERNSASTPEPRTSHIATNIEIPAERGGEVDVRYNLHTPNHRYKTTDHFFGTMFVILRRVGDGLLIVPKKIVLKNDYVRQALSVYHV